MRLKPSSIRLRLTLWYAGVLLLLVMGVSTGAYLFVRSSLGRTLRTQMDRNFAAVATVLAAEPHGAGLHGHVPGNIFFSVVEDSWVVYHSSAWCGQICNNGQEVKPDEDTGLWLSGKGKTYRMKVESLSIGGHSYKVTVAEDTAAYEETLRSLLRGLLLITPGAALLSILGGYFLAGRVLSPLKAMALKAQEISAESLSERLPVHDPEDELGRLATVFNHTLARLEASFERLRTFTANTSHELRTPLTAIRSVGEVALRSPLDAESARDVIGSMLEEVDRLTRLVECLLALARAESGSAQLKGESVDLTMMAKGVLDVIRVLAEERQQQISLPAAESIIIPGDASTLRQALMNLVDNAIRYTPVDGHIQLRIGRDAQGKALVEVEDDGPGIRAEDRQRIFDRFYRSPSDRSQSGAGLGLTIARSAVEANGGKLEYEDAPGGGSLFRMRFPGGSEDR